MRLSLSVCTFLFFFLIMISSCKKEEVETLDKFYGLYIADEQCSSGGDNYEVIITKSDGQLLITNLWDLGLNVKADVNGDSFSIPQQTVTNKNATAYTINGLGNLNNNILTIEYNIIREQDPAESCKLQGVKQ